MESVLDYIGKAHVIIYSICWYILASLNSVYVVAQMAKRGFSFDKNDGKPLREASSAGWLRNNIHVYKRLSSTSFKNDAT